MSPARLARWIEKNAGIVFPALLLAAFWHPSTSSETVLPADPRTEDPPALSQGGKHLLAPDAHRILIEKEDRRLLLFKGNSLMAVYPILGGAGDEPLEAPPEGRFVISGLSRATGRRTQLYLTYSDRIGADRALSSGLLDREAHARIVQSLAEGELPAEAESWGRTFSIHGTLPRPTAPPPGIDLEDEYVMQLAELVRVGTPVEVRR